MLLNPQSPTLQFRQNFARGFIYYGEGGLFFIVKSLNSTWLKLKWQLRL